MLCLLRGPRRTERLRKWGTGEQEGSKRLSLAGPWRPGSQRCGSRGQGGGEEDPFTISRGESWSSHRPQSSEQPRCQVPGVAAHKPCLPSPEKRVGYRICTEQSILSKYSCSPMKDTQGGSGGRGGPGGPAALKESSQEHLPTGPQAHRPTATGPGRVRSGPQGKMRASVGLSKQEFPL